MALLPTQKKSSCLCVRKHKILSQQGSNYFCKNVSVCNRGTFTACKNSAALCTHHWCDTDRTRAFLHWSPRACTSWSLILWQFNCKEWSSMQCVPWQTAKGLPPELQKLAAISRNSNTVLRDTKQTNKHHPPPIGKNNSSKLLDKCSKITSQS